MGGLIGRLFFRKKEVRIIMVGLDAAGKTTALYKMKLGEVVTTIPTIGFNVETIQYKHVNLITWDVGGRDKIRPLRRHYYQNTDALICMIDSGDRERFGEALKETIEDTEREDELRDIPYLILANKQDLISPMKPEEISSEIVKRGYLRNRKWAVFGTSATCVGDDMYEALDWLSNVITTREQEKYMKPVIQNDQKYDLAEKDKKTKWPCFTDMVLAFKKQIKAI